MVVSTKNPCLHCQREGKTSLLQYDVGQGRAYCKEGHSITDSSEIENPKADMVVSQDAVSEPPVATPLAFEPVPDSKPAQTVKASPVAAQEAPRPVPDVPSAPAVKSNGAHVASPLERLAKLGYVEMPGGDVMMQIRIPETYVGSLKESAARYYPNDGEEAFRKHLQNVMDIAINLGWAS